MNDLLLKIWSALDLVEEGKALSEALGRRDVLARLRDAERELTVAIGIAAR